MLTIQFDENSRKPKYEQLYAAIRDDISNGNLQEGTKLPSKRKLAAHLDISINTIESAYAQLEAEGFVDPVEKKGYFVLPVVRRTPEDPQPAPLAQAARNWRKKRTETPGQYVLRNNAVDTGSFPLSTWSRLMRDSLREDYAGLLEELHPQGDIQLRHKIAEYLHEYRDMNVSAERIILGAGTTYLLGMLTELLPGHRFALEEPGYRMIARALQSRNVPFVPIAVDAEGMRFDLLARAGATTAVLTPSNQFPLCRVMSIGRRMQLLEWAGRKKNRFLIEDDYDCDYRYALKPAPTLHSLDRNGKVIYFNTFARTLSPSLRIAYMVLPERLMDAYRPRMQFHSCTVSGFEQRTLLRFIAGGHYERHLNRMRTIYKRRRNALLRGLEPLSDRIAISGAEAGLHLLLQSKRGMREAEMIRKAAKKQVTVFGLSGFFHAPTGETHTVVAGYGGLQEEQLEQAAALLCAAWGA